MVSTPDPVARRPPPPSHARLAVPEATEADTNAAVAAAKAAFPAWSDMDPAKRGACLKRLSALILENNAELARLEAVSMGRPVSEYIDGFAAAGHYAHYAEAWPHIQGQSSLNTPGNVTLTWRQPFGVAAAIIPWNVPLLFFAAKSGPALIAGNTVVLKTSEKAPLAGARVAELIVQAGFPPGVFNILSGHGMPSGARLASHMDVRVLSFTGSSRTGRLIQGAAARSNLKKVILELGGKSPTVVFDDADLEQAAEATQHSVQWNSGQTCMANTRIYVQKSVAPAFVELFSKKFAAVRAGDPTDAGVNHGPQVDEIQYKAVMRYIEEGKLAAARTALGGDTTGSGGLGTTRGLFVEPTVFLDTPEDARIMKEEVFGPVVNINTFETEEEAIAKANDTEFGLYSSVFSRDISRCMRVARALDAGYVAINTTSPATAKDLPFGGYKSSGQGREGWLHSLDNFLETKSVIIKL